MRRALIQRVLDGPVRQAIARLLLSTALLPTEPLFGLGLPVELGFEERGGPTPRRVSSFALAIDRAAAALGQAGARRTWRTCQPSSSEVAALFDQERSRGWLGL